MNSLEYLKRIHFCDFKHFDFNLFQPTGTFQEASHGFAVAEFLKWKQQKKKQMYRDDAHHLVRQWDTLCLEEKKFYSSADEFLQKYRCFFVLELFHSFFDYVENNMCFICPIWKPKEYSDLYLKWKLFSTPLIQINLELRYLSYEFDFLEKCYLTPFEKMKFEKIRKKVNQLQTSLRKRSEHVEMFMKIFYLGNAKVINQYDLRRYIYDFL